MNRHPAATPWDELPDLMLLSEVVAKTRHSLKRAYFLLERNQFPIAPLPNVRPYRFPKARVRAWVEQGTVSNVALSIINRRRKQVA